MNPALPGGAVGSEADLDETTWSASTRLGYAFVPYGELQQGRTRAPNPDNLAIDVHLATLQATATAPTGTSFDAQLPFGTLVTTGVDGERTETGAGDLELRARQSLARWTGAKLGVGLGVVLPTGEYVARSGAANLAPEASYVTLGRGVVWGVADLDARFAIRRTTSVIGQLASRVPLGRASDDFAWGSELRATIAAQHAIKPWLALTAASDVQWRAGATEPDPFAMGRIDAANAGGFAWAVSPAVAITPAAGLSIVAGARIPLLADVTGNQLVPQVGGFVAVSYARALAPRRRPRAQPVAGQITVVDYWASWCVPCAEIAKRLEAAAPGWPDVRVIRLDATAWPSEDSPVLPDGASGLPVVEIFDAAGVRRALLVGDAALRVVEEVEAVRARSKEK